MQKVLLKPATSTKLDAFVIARRLRVSHRKTIQTLLMMRLSDPMRSLVSQWLACDFCTDSWLHEPGGEAVINVQTKSALICQNDRPPLG